MIIGITGNIGSGKDTVAKMIQYYFACKEISIVNQPKLQSFLNGNDIYAQYNDTKFRITKDSNWQIKKFAYKLKQIAAILVGCKAEDFESEEFKNQPLSDEWQSNFQYGIGLEPISKIKKIKRTNRWLLQTLGTEAIRNNIHKNTWVNALFLDYKENYYGNIIKASINEKTNESDWKYPNWIISDLRFLNEAQAIKDRDGIMVKILRSSNKTHTHSSETELNSIYCDFEIANNGTIEELYESVKNFLKLAEF